MTAIEIVRLTNGDSLCEVAPALGGSILRLSVAGAELLRKARPGTDDIQQVACFPLVPFANRIARGRFVFEGTEVAIGFDPDGNPHALHGHGWRHAWTLTERSEDRVQLAFDYAGQGWPWPYRAEQTIALRADGLEIEIALHNRHADKTMPAGAGIHPFFSRFGSSTIAANARACWRTDETGLAIEEQVDDRFSADRPCPVTYLEGVDNFFVSDGDVLVDRRIHVAGDRTVGFHVYVATGQNFFCVEPVSHVPDSFGRGEIRSEDLIAAGGRKSWRFSITDAAPRLPMNILAEGFND